MTAMEPTSDRVAAGHAFYTRRTLRLYDPLILGFFSRAAWRCPASRIVRHYDEHVTSNHLDVGVGTGYFLDRCRFPTTRPRIVLMDPNLSCLDAAAKRIARYSPSRLQSSVLEPIAPEIEPVDSVGLTYVLHCLPGTIADKAVVFEHLAAVLNPDGVVFGATLLQGGVERGWYARQLMAYNNRAGIFSNRDDDLQGLRSAMEEHLRDVEIEVVGCVAVFAGAVPGPFRH